MVSKYYKTVFPSIVAEPSYTPTRNAFEFQCLHFFATIWCSQPVKLVCGGASYTLTDKFIRT